MKHTVEFKVILLRKENGCFLRWGGCWNEGEDECPFNFGRRSKDDVFHWRSRLIFSCVTCDHLPGETSRELWVESGPGRWLSLEIEGSVRMCKVAVGTWLLGTMDIRDVVFSHVSSAWVLLILDFQDGQVLHSLAALCRSVGGMLSPFLGKFLEAHQLWKTHVLFPWSVFNLCGRFPLVIDHDSAQVHIQHSFRRVMTQDTFGLWPSNTTRLGRCCALLLQNEPSPLRRWDDHGWTLLRWDVAAQSMSSFFKLFWTQENRHTSAVCGF